MKTNTPFLFLYKEWINKGFMSHGGLCESITTELRPALDNFWPTLAEFQELRDEHLSIIYWGSGLSMSYSDKRYTFTPLRQTIVLLCAALNGEFD